MVAGQVGAKINIQRCNDRWFRFIHTIIQRHLHTLVTQPDLKNMIKNHAEQSRSLV